MATNINFLNSGGKPKNDKRKHPSVIVVDHCVDSASLQRALGNRADVFSSGVRLAAELVDLHKAENQWVVVEEKAFDRCVVAGNPLIIEWEQSFAAVLIVASEMSAAVQTHFFGYGIRDIVIGDSDDKERTALRVGLIIASYIELLQQRREAHRKSLLYQAAFDHSGDGLWVVDKQRRFVLANRVFSERRGSGVDELLGKSIGTVGDKKVQEWQRQFVEKASLGDIGPHVLSRADQAGNRLDVEVSVTPLAIEGEHYLAGVVREVTDRNVAYEQLTAQLDALKKLLAISNAQSDTLDNQVEKFLRFGLDWFQAQDGVLMVVDGENIKVKHAVGKHRELLLGFSAPKMTSQGSELIYYASASAVENVSASGIDRGREAIPEGVESFIGAPIIVDGESFGVVVFSSDIARQQKYTEAQLLVAELAAEWLAHEFYSKKMEQAAIESERQLRMITDAAQEGIYAVDLDGQITFVNPAAEEMLGFSTAELIGANAHMLIHHSYADGTEYPQADCQLRRAVLEGGALTIGDEVYWRKDGSSFPVEYSVAGMDHDAGAVVLFRDVTQLKKTLETLRATQQELLRANKQLADLATRDPLTQIANRRAFDQTLAEEISRARRYQKRQLISLVMIDVDYFKAYNDHYGHLQGDNCLRKVAQVLKSVARRPADLVARYGGEEFVLLLPQVAEQDAVRIAETARQAVMNENIEHIKSKVDDSVTISCGVATMDVDALHALGHSELVRLGDQALYEAKASGRNRVVVESENRR